MDSISEDQKVAIRNVIWAYMCKRKDKKIEYDAYLEGLIKAFPIEARKAKREV